MLESLLRSIGVADEMVINISDTHIAFQRPLWLYALLLVIPAGWFIYDRQRSNLGTVRRGFRVALTATRVFVLAILILVLASPVLRLTEEIDKKPILAVVFDASQSMQLPAGPFETDEERLAVARAAPPCARGFGVDGSFWQQAAACSPQRSSCASVHS